MSQSNPGDDLEEYRSSAGIGSKTADVAPDDHALKQSFGNSESQKSFQFDAEIIAERISNWYDSDGATIREFLSNAETACIRRAKMELRKAGETVPNEITEVISEAKDKCGYEPLIEVTYNRKSDDTRFIIEDNGCGITRTEYQVLRNIGYSASHGDGSLGDGFGMGIMSFAQLTGTQGMLKFSTRSFPASDREEVAYSVAMYVTNLEFLTGKPDEYGTRFEFPAFSESAKEIDIPSKVEEYAEGMVIPVLYRDYDHDGQETPRSDDYLATRMEEDYADDSMVIIYENEFFKAVMSPDRKETGRGRTTYNISMPIRRNTDGFGSNKFEAPWKWDFRAKQENGPIVSCPSDESLVGQIPKENTKYDRLTPEMQEKCVPMSRVPDDAIVMPEPASSRDSFMGGHDDFWKHVSKKLNGAWADVAKERFENLDSWDDFLDMDRSEKQSLFRAYSHFGPKYKDATGDTIQETIQDKFGVTLDTDLCEKLHESQSKVDIVRRGHNRAHTKGACSSRKIWEVIDEAPDGVYMGKTISQKKAEIVWGLGDTHLVRLRKGQSYDELASAWGWEKAKSLPNTNLSEKLPELDDDVAERFENVSDSKSNNTKRSSTGGNGKDPETYRMKVRVGSNSRKYFSTHRVSNLVDKLEDDESFKAGRYSVDYIILHKDDVSARTVASNSKRKKDVGAARAPKYVYQYLIDKPNVYESMDELRDDHAGTEVTLSDDTEMDIRDLPESDCLIMSDGRIRDLFDGRQGDLVELLGYDSSEFERYTWSNPKDFHGSWGAETDATVIYVGNPSGATGDFNDYSKYYDSYNDLLMEDKLGDVDKDSEEYEALFGYARGKPTGDRLETLIEIAADADIPTND
jgi:hypothetical protein